MALLKSKRLLLIISVAILVAASLCMIGMNAKYTSQRDLHSSVQISLLLQGDEADMYESPNELQTDGSYELKEVNSKIDPEQSDGVKPVLLNKYDYVLPGVNLPKDPKLFVTKKSGAPAYLYIEVFEDEFPGNYTNNGFDSIVEESEDDKLGTDAIFYQLEDYWEPLYADAEKKEPMKGPNDGNLYVYYNEDFTVYSNLQTAAGKKINATYIASYIMDDNKNGDIDLEKYYGSNELKKDKAGNEINVPAFNIIKDNTIYVSEKFIHDEYYSTLATAAPINIDKVNYNFGLYFYGYMASAKENGSYVTPEKAFDNANFLTEEAYEASLKK